MIEVLILHFCACFLVSFFLFLWFDTDSVTEYIKLFRMDKFFFIKEHEEMKIIVEDLSYPQYLEQQPGFVNKILSCPYCLCTWLLLFSNFFIIYFFGFSSIKFFGLDWFFSIIIYVSIVYLHT